MTTIRIEGLDKLMKQIDTLDDLHAVKAGLAMGGVHLKGKIAKYPPRRHGAKQPFKSDKQRRFFFWALKKGLIEVPYRRGQSPGSQALGRRWTIAKRDGGLKVIVGNNTSYGPLVQDADHQTGMHKRTGWTTVQQVAEDESEMVSKLIGRAIEKALVVAGR